MRGGATPRARASLRTLGSFALVFSIIATAGAGTPPSPRIQSLKDIREKAVVMQRWETSCAAAALATVLTYGFNDPVSERHIVAKMLEKTEPAKVKARGGFSLLDMKRFVDERGYVGEAYQYLSLDDLKLFHAPIVPINVHGFNHYVVLNAINDREVLLADPAFGNRRMSLTRFKEVWLNGLVFVVTPQPRSTP
jgi:predicted double-glycine peptidase